MLPRRDWGLYFIVLHIVFGTFHLCRALLLFAPPEPVHLGTTVEITWTPQTGDPPTFNIFLQCDGAPATPALNVTTAAKDVFVSLPSGFNLNFTVTCFIQALAHFTNQFLAQSQNFTVTLDDPPIIPTSARSSLRIGGASSLGALTPIPNPTISSFTSQLTSTGDTATITASNASTTTTSQVVSVSPLVSPTRTPTTIPLSGIIGASVGGFFLLCLSITSFILCVRWRRRLRRIASRAPNPFRYDLEYAQPSSSRSGRSVREVLIEKGEKRRIDPSPNPVALNNSLASTSSMIESQISSSEDTRLRQIVQQMGQRIQALEYNQREPEIQQVWVQSPDVASSYEQQPPPNYSELERPQSTNFSRPLPRPSHSFPVVQDNARTLRDFVDRARAGPSHKYNLQSESNSFI